MVNLTIDDKQVTVAKDATIYDAAVAAGIRIPILCHDKKLLPFGGCRMCLVEVEQMKGRQIPACTTPVTEGMIVRTSTEEIVQARKMVLELLLLKHPLDCPVCDAAGDCDLQNLTYEYKITANRFQDEKFKYEIDYENKLIERDMNRCVLCGKCSRICDEIVSYGALSFVNRGLEANIATPFNGPLECEFCGSCISVCPVGALISRPFKFKARWWALNKVKTVCSYCGTGCQLTLGVKDNQVITTVYDENQGFHNGQLCTRGRFGYQFVNSPKRLNKPLVRKNGQLVEASWEEALKLVSDRLKSAKASNPSAVAGLVTPRLTNEELYLFRKLLKEAVGTDNVDHSAGYAHSALTIGAQASLGYASSPSLISDIQKANLLLVIKSDAYETHPVLGFEINMGVKNKEIVLRILSDKKGKLGKLPKAITHLHKPGNEMAVINAMAKVIIDENLVDGSASSISGFDSYKGSLAGYAPEQVAASTGLGAEDIRNLAREYAKAEKALIMLPLGHGYPGHDAKLAQALLNLAFLTGKIGKEGSGVLFLGEKNNSQGAVDMGLFPTAGGKVASAIIDGCATGAINTLYIAGENPVVSYPERKKVEAALDKVEFLVVQDLFLTETAAKAHVVLPACSFAEKEGSFTSVGRVVQKINKAIPPVGESRSDFVIFKELYAALGGEGNYKNVSDLFVEISNTNAAYKGLSLASLGEEGAILPVAGQASFIAVDAPVVAGEADKLALLTGSALYHCGTMSLYGEGPMAVCPDAYIEFGREDAISRSIADGDLVTVKAPGGELKLKAKVGSRLPQGVVFAPYHFADASINNLIKGTAVTWVSVSK